MSIHFANMGTAAADAVMKTTPTGKQVTTVTVIFNYYEKGAKNAAGEVTNQGSISVKVTAWDNENFKQATYLSQVQKGDAVFLDADLKNATWTDEQGGNHSRLETLSINQIKAFPKGTAYSYASNGIKASTNPVAKPSTPPVAKAPVQASAPVAPVNTPQQAPVTPVAQQTPSFDFEGSNDTGLNFDFESEGF